MLEDIMRTFGMYQCIGDEGVYISHPLPEIHRKATNHAVIGAHMDNRTGVALKEAIWDHLEYAVERTVELDKRGKSPKMLGMAGKYIRLSLRIRLEELHQF